VLEAVTALRQRLAANPSDFLWRQTPPLIESARARLAQYLHCDPTDLLLLPNITVGLNIICNSLKLEPGSEILTTDHEYGAMIACWRRAATRQNCTVREIVLPYRTEDPREIVEAFSKAITPGKTRVLYFSHVNCTTGLAMPVAQLCKLARERGLISVIDGAHAPGMVPVDLKSTGADFYAANCHKWMMAPAGAGFMHVPRESRKLIAPLITSWGYEYDPAQADEPSSGGGSKWQWSYEFHGTSDRTPQMVLPQVLDFRAEIGGDEAVLARTRDLTGYAHQTLSAAGFAPATPINRELGGALIAFDFPQCDTLRARNWLWEKHHIECPVTQAAGRNFLRVSCAWFNTRAEIDALVLALRKFDPKNI
jgi:isopenicillin-N epimerase